MTSYYIRANHIKDSFLRESKFPNSPRESGQITSASFFLKTHYPGAYFEIVKTICRFYRLILLRNPSHTSNLFDVVGRQYKVKRALDRIEYIVKVTEAIVDNTTKNRFTRHLHLAAVKNAHREKVLGLFNRKIKSIKNPDNLNEWVFDKALYEEWIAETPRLNNHIKVQL